MAQVVWNPAQTDAQYTINNGVLTNNSGSSQGIGIALVAIMPAKSYWEIATVFTGSGGVYAAGVAVDGANLNQWLGENASGWGYWNNGGRVHNNVNIGNVTSYISGTRLKFAFDKSAGKFWVGRTGQAWENSGDPAAGTNPSFSSVSSAAKVAGCPFVNNAVCTLHNESGSWLDTAPSGFLEITQQIATITPINNAGSNVLRDLSDALLASISWSTAKYYKSAANFRTKTSGTTFTLTTDGSGVVTSTTETYEASGTQIWCEAYDPAVEGQQKAIHFKATLEY